MVQDKSLACVDLYSRAVSAETSDAFQSLGRRRRSSSGPIGPVRVHRDVAPIASVTINEVPDAPRVLDGCSVGQTVLPGGQFPCTDKLPLHSLRRLGLRVFRLRPASSASRCEEWKKEENEPGRNSKSTHMTCLFNGRALAFPANGSVGNELFLNSIRTATARKGIAIAVWDCLPPRSFWVLGCVRERGCEERGFANRCFGRPACCRTLPYGLRPFLCPACRDFTQATARCTQTHGPWKSDRSPRDSG